MPLIQAVVPADVTDLILRGAGLVLTATMAYMGRELSQMRKELIQWRVFLVGIDGRNGLNSQVKKLDARVGHLERRHGPPDRRTHITPEDA